jgi:hypothetical protein
MGTSANIAVDIVERTTDQKKIDNEFKKGIFDNVFFSNLEGLKENSKIVKFDNDAWKFSPQKFSLDYYKDVSYYKVILLVNNISTLFNFKKESFKDYKIIVPNENEILKVLAYVK